MFNGKLVKNSEFDTGIHFESALQHELECA